MKKSHIIIMVLLVLIVIALFSVNTCLCMRVGNKWIKNSLGSFLGYGTCPNCGDNWWWKDSGGITYYILQEAEDYTTTGNLVKIRISAGVMICKECLASPARLDESKIAQTLLDRQWPAEKAELAKQAVIHYKKEKLNNK